MADQGFDHRVGAGELGGVGWVHQFREGGQQQAVAHHYAGNLGHLVAQGIHSADRVETGDGVGFGVYRGDVDLGVVVCLELAHEGRGYGGAADQLQVVVVSINVLGQGDAAEHDRCGHRLALAIVDRAPVGDTGGQVADVDAAFFPQFIDLGRERTGSAARGSVLVRIVQQGRQTGPATGKKLGQPRRICMRDVDAVRRRRSKPQGGIGAGALAQGFHPGRYALGSSILATSHDSHSLH